MSQKKLEEWSTLFGLKHIGTSAQPISRTVLKGIFNQNSKIIKEPDIYLVGSKLKQ